MVNKYPQIKIFSPSELSAIPITKISNLNTIKTSLNEFQILSTPGHTLDHVVLCDIRNKCLFVGDVLFRLGCGRVFEGTIEQMHNSLNKLLSFPDDMKIYCGHEYTLNNLKFLENIFIKNKTLKNTKKKILEDLKLNNRSIPFILGDEKKLNPFLNPDCEMVSEFKKNNNYSNLEFFRYLREKKDNF